MNRGKLKRICMAVFFIGLGNFFVFAAVAIYLGGDAVNGKVENGHYYVSSHGKDTEVSREMFLYSKAHAHCVFVTHPMALLAAFIASRIDRTEKKRT